MLAIVNHALKHFYYLDPLINDQENKTTNKTIPIERKRFENNVLELSDNPPNICPKCNTESKDDDLQCYACAIEKCTKNAKIEDNLPLRKVHNLFQVYKLS